MIAFPSNNKLHSDLWNTLKDGQLFSRDQFQQAVKNAKEQQAHLFDVLFRNHQEHEEELLQTFAKISELPIVRLRDQQISREALFVIPKDLAAEHSAIVFALTDTEAHVAITNPENTAIVNAIGKKTGKAPRVFLTAPSDIQRALKQFPNDIASEFSRIVQDALAQTKAEEADEEHMAEFVPVIEMVERLLETALQDNASDIHIEQESEFAIVRFRIDGMLKRIVSLPRMLMPALVARIKILANLKIDEHRNPQDGRFNVQFDGRDVAVRVSAIPTLFGTKIVLRLLDTKEKEFTLESLGLNESDFVVMKNEITKPHGMILVTGPTGSGKTTTLYALLRLLNKEEVNISTIEDPIEYGLPGVNQTQVNPNSGLTFVSGLRSLLRQDPNILMVGEIRDPDTAKMAVNAAMTGHLVLTTLHTNNAYLAVQRLIEMGVEPYLASSVLNVVVGQRLVRTICTHCRKTVPKGIQELKERWPGKDLARSLAKLERLGLVQKGMTLEKAHTYRGEGCEACLNTGYRGRIGMYEIFSMNDAMYETVTKNPTARAIQEEAERQGALSIMEDGLLKIIRGTTTLDEVIRVTR